jgi:alkylation response protein AidB-like acyl-CoA dehydrogenase
MTHTETTIEKGPEPSPLAVADLRRRAEELLPGIGRTASDRERRRSLPFDEVRQIAEARLFTFRIPVEHGGPGSSVQDVIRFVIDVAAVDSNLAQALRPGFAFVESLLTGEQDLDHDLWFARLLAGDIVGNAGWEIGGANGAISTRITRDRESFKVTGSKYYSTGALFADWVTVMALDENDEPVSFIIPRDREGLSLVDDFDAMGQRLTASGTTKLDNVTVHAHEIRTRRRKNGRRSPITPFLQLFLGAVEAGIARNALVDAVHFVRSYARPIKHSTAAESVDDPYVQLSVGDIAASAYAAEAVVLKAAAAIDAAWAANLREDLLTRAAVEVAQSQIVAAAAALKAAELAFDVGGASTTMRIHNLDRHWRNARTVANHNPRHWKAAVAGAYYLTGAEPPHSGLF